MDMLVAYKKRLCSVVILCSFGIALVSPLLAPEHSAETQEFATPNHGPCPDADSEGSCDEGCPCLCCPGHATVVLTLVRPMGLRPPRFNCKRVTPRDDRHPDGEFQRVFRPPRG